MNDFINFLNSLGLGAFGAIISGVAACVGGIVAGYKLFQQLRKIWIATKKAIDEHKASKEKMQKDLEHVVSVMSTLSEDVANIKRHNEESAKETTFKIEELRDKVVQGQNEMSSSDKMLGSRLDSNDQKISEISKVVESLTDKTTLLITSDKDSIKSAITDKYFQACKDGYIEMRVLENLEKSYEVYIQENGNTFIGTMMKKLRDMPNSLEEAQISNNDANFEDRNDINDTNQALK